MPSKSSQRVLHITSYYLPHYGGVENYVASLVKHLPPHGFEPGVATTCSGFFSSSLAYGYRVIRSKRVFRLFTAPLAQFDVDEIAHFDPSLIHAHIPHLSICWQASRMSRRLGVPLVITIHNLESPEVFADSFARRVLAYPYHSLLTPRVLEESSAVIATSPLLRLELKSMGFGDRVYVIPVGVDTHKFSPPKKLVEKQVAEVLFVGSMGRSFTYKGIPVLLEAVKEVVRSNPSVRFKLVGAGDMMPHYLKLASSLGIGKYVTFTGYLEEEVLIEQYASCDLLVLPSTTRLEGFGTVVLEAMACGKPVVVSEIAGVSPYIKNAGVGMVVKRGDSRELAEAVLKLLEDQELRESMGRRARKVVEELFSWESVSAAISEVYREALSR